VLIYVGVSFYIIHTHTRTHWYVGGAAESAGVCVGDVVLEVNGEKCEDCDVAKIVALKSIIQQTNVGSS
jgi:C-terminal processing protease CtpA/Prc